MDEKRFWDVIAVGCPHDAVPDEDWYSSLSGVLEQLDPDDIVRFDHWFSDKTKEAYFRELWSAAVTTNGGASDDGFYYFRCWLVGMGKAVFEAALANPDSLADVVDPGTGYYEAEIYGVARAAWEALGLPEKDYDAAYKAEPRRPRAELRGEWVRSAQAFRQRFPRLAAMYLSDEDEDSK
jgi:hypothetical protein